MKTTIPRVIAIAVALLLISACQEVRKYAEIPLEQGLSKQYLSELDKWTKTDTIYSGFETTATIYATYKSGDFVAAYAKEFVRAYEISSEEAKRRKASLQFIGSSNTEFFFFAGMPNSENNNFEKAKSSWNIYLLVDNKRVEPSEIRIIEPVTIQQETFFPYIKKGYGNCYSLSFPLVATGKPLQLVFVSANGKIVLSWK